MKLFLTYGWKWKWQLLAGLLASTLWWQISNPPSPVRAGSSSIAHDVKIVEKINVVYQDRVVKVLVPTPAQEAKLPIPLPPNQDLLAIKELPPTRNGFTLFSTLDDAGANTITFTENKPPIVGRSRERWVALSLDQVWRSDQPITRMGGVELGAGWLRTRTLDWYVVGGLRGSQDGKLEASLGLKVMRRF